jgi:hypothetical protein
MGKRSGMKMFKMDPVEGGIKLVRSEKTYRRRIKVIGEYKDFLIVTALQRYGLFILVGKDGLLKGKIIFQNRFQRYIYECRGIMFIFNKGMPQCMITSFHIDDYRSFNCHMSERHVQSRLDVVFNCVEGGKAFKFAAYSREGSFIFCPNVLSQFSLISFYDVQTKESRRFRLSLYEKFDVTFVFIDEAHHRFLIGISGNRIVVIDWFRLSEKSVYKITKDDVIQFRGSNEFVILNTGELVQFEADGQQGSQRNITILRIYSPSVGCKTR